MTMVSVAISPSFASITFGWWRRSMSPVGKCQSRSTTSGAPSFSKSLPKRGPTPFSAVTLAKSGLSGVGRKAGRFGLRDRVYAATIKGTGGKIMRRSDKKILTSHVGSLPYLVELDKEAADYPAKLASAVAAVVEKQRGCGIDIMNEGEYAKCGDWLSYIEDRFGGFEARPPKTGAVHLLAQGKDRVEFAEFYKYATDKGTLFYEPGGLIRRMRLSWVCTGPITYKAEAALQREIALLKQALKPGEEGFVTTTAPASLEPYRDNEFYKSEEEFLAGIGAAMRVEYRTIVDAGLVLQVDDAWLPALWDRIGMQMGLAAFKKRCMLRVEMLNDALKGIPEDRIRYHLCWGSWHGPHAFDLEMKDFVDV